VHADLEAVLLALQIFQVLFLALHDWIPLGRLNDLKAVRAENPVSKLIRTTLVSTAPFAIGLVASVDHYGHDYPPWLTLWLWISYVLLFAGELRAWWIPYLIVREPARAARYEAMFGSTHSFLPAHNRIRPNTLHVALHMTTLATIAALALMASPLSA